MIDEVLSFFLSESVCVAVAGECGESLIRERVVRQSDQIRSESESEQISQETQCPCCTGCDVVLEKRTNIVTPEANHTN